MRKNALATRWILRSLLLVVAALWAATNSYAQSGVLKDDAYTQTSTPNQNFGANANLRVASGINSYLRFDLSSLPAGTVGSDVGKATLRLYVNTLTTAGLFDVHRVIGAWNEGTITGNSAPSLGGADVTGIGVPAGSVDSFVTVDITALVKDWLDGVIANNGIALLSNAAGISVRFDSKENGTSSHEPRLEIALKGLADVAHDGTLSGDGTSGNPLGVANQGVANAQLANGAVSSAKIAAGQVVKSLNLLKDDVNLAAGSNVTITPSGSTLTIAAAGGLTGVSHNTTLIGDGTGGSPLSVAAPLTLTGSDGNAILSVANSGSGSAITATGDINTSTQYRIGGSRVLSIVGGNVVVGVNAGQSNTTGTGNAFFGTSAGVNNTTGNNNAFFGKDAGFSNTTGPQNAFFGAAAGLSSTTGDANAFFGEKAGGLNTTGCANAFFGNLTGFSNTTGCGNAFFGQRAGFANTGSENAFFGTSAGVLNETGNGNAFFGQSAGAPNTTGSNNTFIGSHTSAGASNLNNATAIGANALVEQSNSVVLGNNANVGIGITKPGSKLTVAGIIESTSGGIKFPDGTSQTTAATGGGGTITGVTAGTALTGGGTTGNVTISLATAGVNTAQLADGAVTVTKLGFDPATQVELDAHKGSGDHDSRYALIAHTHNVSEVNNAATLGANNFLGDQTINGTNVTVGNPTFGGSITLTNTVNRFVDIGSNIGFDSVSGTSVGIRLKATNPIEADSYGIFLGSNVFPGAFVIRKDDLSLPSSERNRFVIAGNGDVIISPGSLGVGTSAPQQKLDVIGNIKISGSGNGLVFPDGTTQATAATGGGGTITGVTAGTALTGGGTTGNVTIAVATSGVNTAQIADSAVTVTKLGFDPATQGELDAHKISGDHDSRYALIAHTHNVSEVNNAATLGANLFVGNQTVDGRLGIGTPNPAERLTVASSSNPTIEVVPLAGGQTSGLRVYNASSRPNQGFFLLLDAAGELRTGNNVSWPYTFYTNGSERMRISQTGNVGIGTADPAERLTVTGSTNPTIEVVPSAGGQTSGLRVYSASTRPNQGFFLLDDAVGELRTGNNVSWPYTFRTNGSEQMRISQTGNVGIGTTSPQAKLHVIGDFVATGTKSAIVALPDKRVVSLYAVESPENWFEDFGSAKLTGGVAEVALDSTFSQTVNTDMTYHVFLTPNGNSQGLYVAQKTSSSFEVREQGEGKSDVAFDYRIVARRRGYEELRLREVPPDSPAATATNRRIP